MNRKGLSGIVTAVIMIALVMGAAAIVWIFVSNMVVEKLESSSSCSGIFDKVTLNNAYTCYNSSKKELLFSVNQEDVEVDKIIIGVSGGGISKSFEIPSTNPNLRLYPSGAYNAALNVPGNNSGMTYVLNYTGANFSSEFPDEVQITPVVNDVQCEVSDRIDKIEICALLLN
jgi:flagellin-like protein